MGIRIRGLESYQAQFPDTERRERAYKLALDIRKFEIELYWKRATYFWTLIAATFGGYFALASSERSISHPGVLFLLSCIGLVLSTSWYLVNRGSKYWQENWERHVDSLEDEFAGPLYKTTISNQRYCWWKPSDGYPFSVSKVNQLTSFFVALVWLALAILSFPLGHLPVRLVGVVPWGLALFTLLFLGSLVFKCGRSGRQDKDREIDFYKVAVVPPKSD